MVVIVLFFCDEPSQGGGRIILISTKTTIIMSSQVAAVDVKALAKNLWAQYRKSATTQTDITDLFLFYVLATGVFQVRGKVMMMMGGK